MLYWIWASNCNDREKKQFAFCTVASSKPSWQFTKIREDARRSEQTREGGRSAKEWWNGVPSAWLRFSRTIISVLPNDYLPPDPRASCVILSQGSKETIKNFWKVSDFEKKLGIKTIWWCISVCNLNNRINSSVTREGALSVGIIRLWCWQQCKKNLFWIFFMKKLIPSILHWFWTYTWTNTSFRLFWIIH